jgi:anti-sigma regulatory factor (Ser/Thr protein kinase)
VDVRARTTLPSSVSTPAAARAFAREALDKGNASVRIEDVALVVSELVTNAVVHGDGDITLNVVVAEGAILVEVEDREPELPGRLDPRVDAESGRGLLLVSRIAREWGVRPAAGRGKVVWADLPAMAG